jgi:hypothetical protein
MVQYMVKSGRIRRSSHLRKSLRNPKSYKCGAYRNQGLKKNVGLHVRILVSTLLYFTINPNIVTNT